jgi:rhomboid family GlyGly-CTERM serine protease
VPSSADGGRLWVALAAVLALCALGGGGFRPGALEWQPALAWREPWRAWTAVAVHYSALHLVANLAGAALVGALGWFARLPRSVAIAWLAAWPLTQLGLLARPDLLHYGGLSGVLHAGVACAAWPLAAHARGARRAIGVLVLVGLAIKVASESPWGAPLRAPPGWDIATAPFAHASGLVAGIVAAVVCDAIARLRPHSPLRSGDAGGDGPQPTSRFDRP